MHRLRRAGEAAVVLVYLWRDLGRGVRLGVLVVVGALLWALIALTLFGGGEGDDAAPAVTLRPVPAASTATATAVTTGTATATSTPASTPVPGTATPAGTPTPEPTPATPTPEPAATPVASISDLHARYGEPPSAGIGRMRIPALAIDAPLGETYVGGDGQMPNPHGPSDVVWYDFAAWEGYGGTIGGGNNAIFSGHVDYAAHVAYADVDFRGRGVFYDLGLLSPGDIVEVESGGLAARYVVLWRRLIDADAGDWGEILGSEVDVDSITLITCGGEFDHEARSYADRIVVRAVRI